MSSNSECFGCGRSGHWVKHCPNASGARGRGRGRGRGKGTVSISFIFFSISRIRLLFQIFELY